MDGKKDRRNPAYDRHTGSQGEGREGVPKVKPAGHADEVLAALDELQ
jgi:hypothetical protein